MNRIYRIVLVGLAMVASGLLSPVMAAGFGPEVSVSSFMRPALRFTTAAQVRDYLQITSSATNLTLSGGVLANSESVIDASATWNDGADTFTGWRLNITDTASAAASKLIDAQVGGVTQFAVRKDGIGYSSSYFTSVTGYRVSSSQGGSSQSVQLSNGGLTVDANDVVAWGNSSSGFFGTADTILTRDAAGTLAQRNGVNAQAFRVYNTYTDSSNYERGALFWTGNDLKLSVENAGTGSAARQLHLASGSSGHLRFYVGASQIATVSASGITSVASDITSGDDVWANSTGSLGFLTRSRFTSPSDGAISALNNGQTASASLLAARSVNAKTADYVILPTESGRVFSNAGAAGQTIGTLPAGASGLTYTFAVTDAQNMRIVANGAEQIRVAASISTATTGYIQASTVGNSITLVWMGTFWMATATVGTWPTT